MSARSRSSGAKVLETEKAVLLDRPAPSVMRVRINRPSKRNAIDHAVREGIIDALKGLGGDGSVRALVLGGVEGVFSAGGDLPSMAGLDTEQAAHGCTMFIPCATLSRVAGFLW
jgi:enoyl-CoA hydratase/carnithine racemase